MRLELLLDRAQLFQIYRSIISLRLVFPSRVQPAIVEIFLRERLVISDPGKLVPRLCTYELFEKPRGVIYIGLGNVFQCKKQQGKAFEVVASFGGACGNRTGREHRLRSCDEKFCKIDIFFFESGLPGVFHFLKCLPCLRFLPADERGQAFIQPHPVIEWLAVLRVHRDARERRVCYFVSSSEKFTASLVELSLQFTRRNRRSAARNRRDRRWRSRFVHKKETDYRSQN